MITRKMVQGMIVWLLLAITGSAWAQVDVTDAEGFRAAFAAAEPGDVIRLAAGEYAVDQNLVTPRAGRADAPIRVLGPETGEALIRFSRTGGGAVEGFKVQHAYWGFEGLVIEGACEMDSQCEHAWHLIGDADHTVIRGNIVRDFNAHIKSNRGSGGGEALFPDDVLVEGNEFYSTAIRDTSTPVTPIDVVGGRRWIIRANFIHDHAKGGADGISYAAFLKGGSSDGVIERNLVACEWLHSGQIRLGLSFGGGGSSPDSICESGSCSPEHRGGVMRNNIVIRCPADVGVFVRECDGCSVLNNTLFDTSGIDFIENSTGLARGNLLSGRIRDRLGSVTSRELNQEMVSLASFRALFRAPGEADFTPVGDISTLVDQLTPVEDVFDDYCRRSRVDGMHDVGALELSLDTACDTTRPLWGEVMMPPGSDGGIGVPDGGPSSDAGPSADAGTIPGDAQAPEADAGAAGLSAEGGCGCRISSSSDGQSVPVLLFALGLVAALLRRPRVSK